MKNLLKLQILVGLFFILLIPISAFSQAGLTDPGGTQPGLPNLSPDRANSGVGFDTGTKGGSALQQLENIAGRNISTSNTNTRATVAPTVKTISAAAAFQNSMRMQVASGIASAFFGMLFSDNSQSNAQAAEAQRQQAVFLAQQAAEEKRIADLIAQEKYDQMMKSYKLLNDPNGLQIKSLSTGNLQFKSLDQSAPLTMEERELQNIRKHLGIDGKPISVTWNSNDWANISPDSNMIEENNSQEESDEYKKLDEISEKHKSDDGGREAEGVGIFMKHRIISTMSYLKDVSDAVARNDWKRLGELGSLDDAKMVSNDLKASVGEFKDKLISEGKGKVIGFIKGANDAIINDGVKDVIVKYAPKDLVDTWNTYVK